MKFAPRRIERVLLIVNPASRRGSRIRTKALKAFSDAGVDCDLMETEAPGHAGVLAKAHAHKYHAVFTLGGDGTVMEVLSALAHKGPPVGVLAGGTANVVARTLRIPLNPTRAVPLLLSGDEATMDLGRLGDGRRFAIGVGVGLDATMISEAPARLKKRFGFMAYVVGGYKAVLRNQKFTLRLTVDGVVYERTASAVLVANFGAVLNNLVAFGDGIVHDDGLLNACVFSPGSLWDAVRILWRMIRKDFGPDRCLFYKSGREFRIETIPPMIAQADGELLPDTPLSVSVDPLAGCLLIPRKEDKASPRARA
ncbi:MAG: diacylglycerol kinase family lipid kinase [Gemmatimonadota bacterium]|nr:diacylglycerol kinase family lipid kinase [Gemmatimonadota bacterium]